MSNSKRSDKYDIRTHADIFDPAVLNTKSNAELLDEIEKMMAPAPGEDIDTDRIEQYLAILQERAPVMEDYDPAEKWDELIESHPMLFTAEDVLPEKEEQKPSSDGKSHRRPLRVLRFVEVAAVVVLLLMVTVSAMGVNPVKAILNWAEGVVHVYSNPSGVMELPADAPSEFRSLEEALLASNIDPQSCPKWVPSDYELYNVYTKDASNLIKCSANYQAERGELLIRVTRTKDDTWSAVTEREDGGYIYQHEGVEYYIISNHDLSKAGWQQDGCAYVISGQISESELKEMIDSIT